MRSASLTRLNKARVSFLPLRPWGGTDRNASCRAGRNLELGSPNLSLLHLCTNKDMCHQSLLPRFPKWFPGSWQGLASFCVGSHGEGAELKWQGEGREPEQGARRQGGPGQPRPRRPRPEGGIQNPRKQSPEKGRQTQKIRGLPRKCLEVGPPGPQHPGPSLCTPPPGSPVQTVGNPSGTLCSNQKA